MHSQGPPFSRSVARAVVLVAVLVAIGVNLATTRAEGAPDWEPTGLAEPVTTLFGPTSGALLAARVTASGRILDPVSGGILDPAALWRSDDAGDTWAAIALPPLTYLVAVDPTDHATLYAMAASGLFKSDDGGVGWVRKLRNAYGQDSEPEDPVVGTWQAALKLTVSPADHRVLYISLSTIPYYFRFVRSRDGGETWEADKIETASSPSCGWQAQALLASAAEPGRVLRADGCTRLGRGYGRIAVSSDFGARWSGRPLPGQKNYLDPDPISPTAVDGWHAGRPSRLYVAADRFRILDLGAGRTEVLGSALFRTDDDGQSYREILTFTANPDGSGPRLGAVAADPANPDAVYAAVGGGVLASRDGGEAWAPLGRRDLPTIRYLLVGVDGRSLFAATDRGVYRLRLAGPG